MNVTLKTAISVLSYQAVAATYITKQFDFESIDLSFWTNIIRKYNWLVFFVGAVYLITIYFIKIYMCSRKAYSLKLPLIVWNTCLGIFSILGVYRTVQFLAKYSTDLKGLHRSLCIKDGLEDPMAFWGVAFAISKFIELGDTYFIVLRKRNLQFLQWYHHLKTLVAVWITFPDTEPIGIWFIIMNYAVHSLMYPYFALKVAGVRVSVSISYFITVMQCLQMGLGFLFNAYTIIAIRGFGDPCYRTTTSMFIFTTLYGTFIWLFGRLLFRSKQVVQRNFKIDKKHI